MANERTRLIVDFDKKMLSETRSNLDKATRNSIVKVNNARLKTYQNDYDYYHRVHINLSKRINTLVNSGVRTDNRELQELLTERNNVIQEKIEAKEVINDLTNDINELKGKDFYVQVNSYASFKILYSELKKMPNPMAYILEKNIRAIRKDLKYASSEKEIESKTILLQKNQANLEVLRTGSTLDAVINANAKKYKELKKFLEQMEKEGKKDKTGKPKKSTSNYPFFFSLLIGRIEVY